MKEIRLRIMGGLGNQLYQFAAARYLQKKYGAEQLIIDSGAYDTYKIRRLEIDQLLHNNTTSIINEHTLVDTIIREAYHVYQKLYRDITKMFPAQKLIRVGNRKYFNCYIEGDLQSDCNCEKLYLYGYFVSAKNAIAVKSEMMRDIYLKDENKTKEFDKLVDYIQNKECVAISVRCAEDYVQNGWPICSKRYYQKGLEYILAKKDKRVPIYVFADDIEKVEKEGWFSDYSNIVYIKNLSVCESFELMRRCSDYVCSNSSFSWWGAFLSYSTNSIIINPNKIFSGNSEKMDALTFYNELTLLNYKTGELIK